MQLFKKDHVFIILTERTIRYLTWTEGKTNEQADHGELVLDSLILEDGQIVNSELLTSMLTHLVEQKKWKRRKLSFIVPDNSVTMRQESIPKQLTEDEVTSYIKLHLKGSIRLPFKDPYLDYHILREAEDETKKIALFAYPSERLKPFDELFEKVGFMKNVADISYLSLYRSYLKADLATENEHLLMVQWNKFDLILTVFNQHIPMFSRHIEFSQAPQAWKKNEETKQLEWQSSMLTLPEFVEEQLISIDRFIDFYQYSVATDGGQVDQILLAGDFPNQTLLEQQLSGRVEFPIEKIQLPNDLPPEYAELYGLGLRGERFD